MVTGREQRSINLLEKRTQELVALANTMRGHIESHDFSLARMEADAIWSGLGAINRLANRIADKS